jgi:hypothetical protein
MSTITTHTTPASPASPAPTQRERETNRRAAAQGYAQGRAYADAMFAMVVKGDESKATRR